MRKCYQCCERERIECVRARAPNERCGVATCPARTVLSPSLSPPPSRACEALLFKRSVGAGLHVPSPCRINIVVSPSPGVVNMARVETIVFLSLVLDLFAFTIPLPLFPRIIEWYTKVGPIHREPAVLNSDEMSSARPLTPMASFHAHWLECPASDLSSITPRRTLRNGTLFSWEGSWAPSSREYEPKTMLLTLRMQFYSARCNSSCPLTLGRFPTNTVARKSSC